MTADPRRPFMTGNIDCIEHMDGLDEYSTSASAVPCHAARTSTAWLEGPGAAGAYAEGVKRFWRSIGLKLTYQVSGSALIQCYAPATGESLGRVNPSTAEGIDRAIAKAKEAQVQWAQTTFAERRRVLKTMLKFILENQETIARVACLDSGKTMVDAALGEILVTTEKLRWVIRHGEESLKSERRPTNLLMMYKWNEVMYQPLGVVAALHSWNYPLHNALSPIIASIFAGNAIVVKGSEATAWSSTYFTSIVARALEVCGHSSDIVQSIVCWPNVAEHLTSHPEISHITFIGSREVAHHVCASAAKSLTPTATSSA
ncbi:hypothetical protein OPT61_g10603 [Boeremia exigua]|uniref:Uncharacterized protein n=1 Tax=Boeremia exigua TaxID=749465 RepID=A0ACC2HPA0_9PLEO|nr:hypothetical protein OPT61_g10603 [Boeremia exigua]